MEVHHHPDLHHEKKNFREYFLEFLMIFLAVTMGFIAESLREHISNHSKEKEYITGFIHNVQDDTSFMRHVIAFDSLQRKGIDSMLRLSHINLTIDSNLRTFYHLAVKYFYNSSSFKSNDATLQQLKNTGDYRLITKDHVADSLTAYDAAMHSIYSQGAYYDAYFKEILSRLDDLTDMTILGDTSYIKKGNWTGKPLPPLRDDKNNLPTLFNKIFDFGIITSSYQENYLQAELTDASNLIIFLQKEYNVKE